MKIAFFGVKEQEKKQYLEKNLSSHKLTFFEHCIAEDNLPKETDFEVISIFVDCIVTKKVIDALPNLKLIAIRATGFDNVDNDYAKQKGILVTNVPDYGSHTVAEFTFGLILSLSRNIPEAIFRIKFKTDYSYEGLRGFDLYHKTLGVIGTGKIGKRVISIAKGFEMNVLAYDPYPNQDLANEIKFEYTSLNNLLEKSDIITIHCPATEETKHLINKDNIFKMKKGALLINTARGSIVDTDALYQALKKDHLAEAALDVLEEEKELKEESSLFVKKEISPVETKTLLENHLLINLPQVIFTPHMAFYTKEAEDSILQTTIENINSFLENKPINVVNS